jgi:hypothetical protein
VLLRCRGLERTTVGWDGILVFVDLIPVGLDGLSGPPMLVVLVMGSEYPV